MLNIFALRLMFILSVLVIGCPVLADRFTVIKLEMPDQKKYMTYIFDSQGNRCKQVLARLHERYLRSCKDCKTVQNACVDSLPRQYTGVFDSIPLEHPYMILSGLLTQAIVYEGFGRNTFNSICRAQKKQTNPSFCVYPDTKTANE